MDKSTVSWTRRGRLVASVWRWMTEQKSQIIDNSGQNQSQNPAAEQLRPPTGSPAFPTKKVLPNYRRTCCPAKAGTRQNFLDGLHDSCKLTPIRRSNHMRQPTEDSRLPRLTRLHEHSLGKDRSALATAGDWALADVSLAPTRTKHHSYTQCGRPSAWFWLCNRLGVCATGSQVKASQNDTHSWRLGT
ncbi:hypothetical protein VTK26DRAFT_2036 [Humicola hyalothermophila]